MTKRVKYLVAIGAVLLLAVIGLAGYLLADKTTHSHPATSASAHTSAAASGAPLDRSAHDGSQPPGQSAPTATTPPSISGSAVEAQTLTANPGTWNGPSLTFAFQWNRCSSTGSGCSPIASATGSTYRLTADDVGAAIVVSATASNKNGSAIASSAPTAAISAAQSPTSTTTTTTPTTTTPTTTTPTTTTPYSSARYVWCTGDPTWNYNQTNLGGISTPGWAFDWGNGLTSTSSVGWHRHAVQDSNILTKSRVYFDDSQFPNLMTSVSGSYGQTGKIGPCRTVAVRIDGNDPQEVGVNNPSQGSVIRMDDTAQSAPYTDGGPRPSNHPQAGTTKWYGYAAATNPGYVPHYDSVFGTWNSFGLEWHASIGILGPIMQEITTIQPTSGLNSGPNGSNWWTCGAAGNFTRLATPRLEIALTAGLNDATVDDANHTCRRYQGPNFVAGHVYKVLYKITWDAFGHGSFQWYVDGVLYADVPGVSTMWRNSSGAVDTMMYPQLLNYRKYDTSLPSDIMYYGGYIVGSTMTDVQVP